MKLFKITTLLGVLMMSMTGCTLGSESPEKLIKDKPIYNEENKLIYQNVSKIIANRSSLVLPSNSQDVGKINKIDLDNDGNEEIIAFEKSKNLNTSEYEVGCLILNENSDGTYKDIGEISQSGECIEYANFYDLDNDGNKEIILAIKNQSNTNLYISKFKDGEIEGVYKLNSTWINNRQDLTDIKIEIGYINNDNILDILMINYDSKNSQMYASVVNFDSFNNSLKLLDYVKFDNVKNIKDLYITLGTLSTKAKGSDIKGVVLDIPIIKYGNYLTQMLYFENDKLKKAFKDNDKNLMKSYYVPVEDINNDKVLDIPILNSSLNENTYTSKSSANISWYNWNGKTDSTSGLLYITQVYYNYEYNYKFFIPNNLANKIYIEQEYNNDNILFKFYYNDTMGKDSKNLFTIIVSSKTIVDESKTISLGNQVSANLEETDKYTFGLTIDDKDELEKLDITIDALRDYFSLIYE